MGKESLDPRMLATPGTMTASGAGTAVGVAISLSGFGVGRGTVFHAGARVAGRYQVLDLLGFGGMGEVYAVRDLVLDQEVALKTVRAGWGDRTRGAALLRKELLLARRITHPSVCDIHDLGVHAPGGDEEIAFFTMELLRGETLAARLARRAPMSPAEASPIVAQLCAGLAAAHAHGIVHRDFKSQNVILTADAEGCERAVITDFGLALVGGTGAGPAPVALTSTTLAHAGTAAYMAPEQVLGHPVGVAADLYAFGVVLFEMLTGRLPFIGDSPMAQARRRLDEPAPRVRDLRPDIDPVWDVAVATCLERRPAARFASCAALARALGLARVRRRRWPTIVVTLAALAALGLAFVLDGSRAEPRPRVARLAPGTSVPMALQVGGSGDEIVQALARCRDGALCFGGMGNGPVQLGHRRLAGNGQTRFGLIGALRRDGTIGWASALTSGCDTLLVDLKATSDGDVVATGLFCDRLLVNGVPLAARPGKECFVVRFAGDTGQPRWAHSCNTSGFSHGRRILIDGADNAYVSVDHSGEVGDDDVVLAELPDDPLAGHSSPMVMSFAADGAIRWRSAATNRARAGVGEMQLLGDTLVATGSLSAELSWGDATLTALPGPSGFSDHLLMGLDAASGSVRWAERWGGPGRDGGGPVRATRDGRLVAAIGFGGGEIEPGVTHETEGLVDLSVVAFDPTSHRPDWAVAFSGTGFDSATVLEVLPNDDLLVGGRFDGRLSLGELVLEATPPHQQAFLIRFSPRGEVRGARTFPGGGQRLRALLVEDDGSVTIAGKFTSWMEFDDVRLESRGQSDGYVVTLGRLP